MILWTRSILSIFRCFAPNNNGLDSSIWKSFFLPITLTRHRYRIGKRFIGSRRRPVKVLISSKTFALFALWKRPKFSVSPDFSFIFLLLEEYNQFPVRTGAYKSGQKKFLSLSRSNFLCRCCDTLFSNCWCRNVGVILTCLAAAQDSALCWVERREPTFFYFFYLFLSFIFDSSLYSGRSWMHSLSCLLWMGSPYLRK